MGSHRIFGVNLRQIAAGFVFSAASPPKKIYTPLAANFTIKIFYWKRRFNKKII